MLFLLQEDANKMIPPLFDNLCYSCCRKRKALIFYSTYFKNLPRQERNATSNRFV